MASARVPWAEEIRETERAVEGRRKEGRKEKRKEGRKEREEGRRGEVGRGRRDGWMHHTCS